jgi:hypothetical protein
VKRGIAIGVLIVALTGTTIALLARGDRPTPPPPGPRTDAERVAATVREQGEAIAAGQGVVACEHFTTRARERVQRIVAARAGAVDCAFALGEVAGHLPPRALAELRRPQITEVRVHGDRAVVAVAPPRALLALARQVGLRRAVGTNIPLRRVGGGWKVDGVTL